MRKNKQFIALFPLVLLLCAVLYLMTPGQPLNDLLGLTPPVEQPPVDNEQPDGNTDPGGDTPPSGGTNPGDDDPPAGSTNPGDDNPPTVVDPPSGGTNPGVDDSPVIVDPPKPPVYEYSADVSAYLSAIETTYTNQNMLLVNKQTPLGATYIPSNLTWLSTGDTLYGKTIQLDATAATALKAMLLCMRADGITDAYVTSGYRAYEDQVRLQNQYLAYEKSTISADAIAYFGMEFLNKFYYSQGLTKLGTEDAMAVVLSYSAPPGKSEHQSGLCVDFMTTHMTALTNEQFERTAAFRWLKENAAQFGFILRYPEDKTDITGYAYESWHYRFVGRDAALTITEHGITLEEYLNAAG